MPTIRDLDAIVKRPGRDNDLVELTRLQPALDRSRGRLGLARLRPGPEPTPADLQIPADDDFDQGAFGEAICALSNGETNLEFFRAYTPELVGWFDDFGHSGFIDAIGGIGRIGTTFNPFSVSLPAACPTSSGRS